ncbi:Pentatricopeptide repeat-containing protein [Acorus gramineus]|uniref:Pentatricopeptide repeat-containing protein n=1 Tax=Acorus gramineus TaxID=55184 RepID=A0AAV9APF0_ACOGR|nr:Pentatricopeptide repeat-containing protein [Acorus gramineus]
MLPSQREKLNQHILSNLEKCKHLHHIKQLQSHLITLGHEHTQFLTFKLLRSCSVFDVSYARLIFDRIPSPNVYLFTAMITAYSILPDPPSALSLFNSMLRRPAGRPKPNHFLYPHIIRSSSDMGDPNLIGSVHARIAKTGFGGYPFVETALVDAYCRCADVKTAREVFDGMRERSVVSWTAMVSGYARAGELGEAVKLFEEMPERDAASWNAVIAGCAQSGLVSEAVSFFKRMRVAGEKPNETTVVCALSACGHLGMVMLGRWAHGYAKKQGFSSSPFVLNALVDMYGKCGRLGEASRVFDGWVDRGLTAWNSMINCLALHGRSVEAVSMFEEMRRRKVHPDEVTFVGLFNACTHGGLVDEGLEYFESMRREHGIERKIEHYGCLIDLLGRAGRLREAMEVAAEMEMEPDEVIWGCLLNGCRIHGEVELAEVAMERLLAIDPRDAGNRAMLANMYGEHGRWEKVRLIRRNLKGNVGKKLPGCSWVEIENVVHQFYSSDAMHPAADEIYVVLECLADEITRHGDGLSR